MELELEKIPPSTPIRMKIYDMELDLKSIFHGNNNRNIQRKFDGKERLKTRTAQSVL